MKHPRLVEVMSSASLTCFSKLCFSLVSFLDAVPIDSYKIKPLVISTLRHHCLSLKPLSPVRVHWDLQALVVAAVPAAAERCGTAPSLRAARTKTCSDSRSPPPPPPRVSYQRLAVKCLICLQPNSSSMQSQLGWFISLLIVISEFLLRSCFIPICEINEMTHYLLCDL